MQKDKNARIVLLAMLFYSIALILPAMFIAPLRETWQGFITILTSPAQLTMDYFKLGSPAATFLNSGVVGLGCTLVFWLSGFSVNGVSLMAYFLTIGFSFFGMNALNIWPCIFGTWLFTRVSRVKFADQVNIAVFSTALSPFVSEGIFRYPILSGTPYAVPAGILLGILLGCIAGFLMPIMCKHSPNLHKGYSLYNAAAVAGFIGILLFSTMFRAAGVEIPTNTDIGDSYPLLVNIFSVVTALILIIVGFLLNGKSFKGYGKLLTSTGYQTDFTKSFGNGLTLMNIGIFCLFVTAYYNLTGAKMTGPTAGSIVCLLAIAPCGAHILNMLPIMVGYGIAAALCPFDLNTQAIIVGLCFAGALIPISGRFGSICGVLAGLVHALLVTTVVTFHGGFCLYNGGFTAGISAILLAPILENFFTPSDTPRLLPKRKIS